MLTLTGALNDNILQLEEKVTEATLAQKLREHVEQVRPPGKLLVSLIGGVVGAVDGSHSSNGVRHSLRVGPETASIHSPSGCQASIITSSSAPLLHL